MPAISHADPAEAPRTPIVSLPGSKSIAARALIARAISGFKTKLLNIPDCDDTRELSDALRQLSHVYDIPTRQPLSATDSEPTRFDLGTGGTSLRFFVALAAALPGLHSVVDCSDALRRRPIRPLVESLRQLGADISFLGPNATPPLLIRGRQLHGGAFHASGAVSSQFYSAILLAGPLMNQPPLASSPDRAFVSSPYIAMTRRVLADFFPVAPDCYTIEADWSAAAFFFEAALLLPPGHSLFIPDLLPPELSCQGDAVCARLFSQLGVNSRFTPEGAFIYSPTSPLPDLLEADMKEAPDLVPALAAGCSAAGIRFQLTGVAHLRHKESDRLATLSAELSKAGFILTPGPDSLSWRGEKCTSLSSSLSSSRSSSLITSHSSLQFDAHGDHRIAMALAVAFPDRKIKGKDCVSKSFPDFFNQLSRLRE